MRKRIAQFVSKLESLPHSELPSEQSLRNNFYPFSNERGIDSVIKTFKTTKPQTFEKNTIRVAILIGQSSFCSLLSLLSQHCDMIVFADVNPYLIMHTRRILELLKYSQNRHTFEQDYALIKEEFLKDFHPSQVTPDLAMRKEILGEDHFLYSDENFQNAQQAALKVTFAFSHINLFHAKDRVKFFECFHRRKCAITFFNATNLYEWDAPIALAKIKSKDEWAPSSSMLEKIFLAMTQYNPIIMFSTRENSSESCALKAELCFSFAKYWEINKLAAQKYLTQKFPEIIVTTEEQYGSPQPQTPATPRTPDFFPLTPTGFVEEPYESSQEQCQTPTTPRTPDFPPLTPTGIIEEQDESAQETESLHITATTSLFCEEKYESIEGDSFTSSTTPLLASTTTEVYPTSKSSEYSEGHTHVTTLISSCSQFFEEKTSSTTQDSYHYISNLTQVEKGFSPYYENKKSKLEIKFIKNKNSVEEIYKNEPRIKCE